MGPRYVMINLKNKCTWIYINYIIKYVKISFIA
jgi:hypothetical protein